MDVPFDLKLLHVLLRFQRRFLSRTHDAYRAKLSRQVPRA